MNGIHDMGGMHGFGRVVREKDEPIFHHDWEKRAFGVSLQTADSVGFVDDHLRRGIERIPADTYLKVTYYELWMRSLEAILEEKGVLTSAEINRRAKELSGATAMSDVTFEEIAAAVEGGASTRRPGAKVDARFKIGDVVRVKNDHPFHHTRATRYSRGKTGEIVRAHGIFVYPDTNSEWRGEDPQHVYTVRFSAREIWGEAAVDGDSLCLDLWEPYLEQP